MQGVASVSIVLLPLSFYPFGVRPYTRACYYFNLERFYILYFVFFNFYQANNNSVNSYSCNTVMGQISTSPYE